MNEWLKSILQPRGKYARPYCNACKMIWGRASIGRLFNCPTCLQPLRLKSFNPWLKALGGLGVICAGAGTLVIPNMPVLWIGGFLWGGSLIFNGFRQWWKIRRLDAEPRKDTKGWRAHNPDVMELEVLEQIVSCPSCGTKNRVVSHASRERPICGRCRSSLPDPLAARTRFNSLLSLFSNPRVLLGAAAVIFVGFVVWAVVSPPRQQNANPPPQLAPVPIRPVVTDSPFISRPIENPSPPPQAADEEALPARSLPTGTMLTTGYLNGRGKLTLENGTSLDAVATVVDTSDDTAIASFYVQSGQNNTVSGIPNGYFKVIYALGRDWDSTSQGFTRSRSFGRYDKPLGFSTETRVEGDWVRTYYDTQTLTLHKVPGGNVTTSRISESEFKKYLLQTGVIRPE